MRSLSIIFTPLFATLALSIPSTSSQEALQADAQWNSNISISLFAELEELARIVDISYCVGTTGISKPFECASRCSDFPDFELVDTFNTGPLMSDSCGYIVLDHGRGNSRARGGRIIVAFRGTYSIANTIVDLSTVPQEYVPYPGNPDNSSDPGSSQEEHRRSLWDLVPRFLRRKHIRVRTAVEKPEAKCKNCTVHSGFWTSWQNTRPSILPHLNSLHAKYPAYSLHLIGHSLGGAVAALAGLEFNSLGWDPTITTFGEPRVGNSGLRDYIDAAFELPSEHATHPSWKPITKGTEKYRRLTHVDDPVPLLPLHEWGYRPHSGEIFISKAALQPGLSDIRACYGDEDINCSEGAEVGESWFNSMATEEDAVDMYNHLQHRLNEKDEEILNLEKRWGLPIPARYKMWQLFFAHRDYFWRLGLCVPGGDPLDWGRDKYRFDDGEGKLEL